MASPSTSGPLEGSTAIITGGGGTIGPYYARYLAEAGASVALVDLDLAKAETAATALQADGFRVIPIQGDVTSSTSSREAVRQAVAELGPVDILINNAGYAITMDWEDITEDEWDRTVAVNIKGCFHMSQAVTPFMKQRGRGKIVSLTSAVAWLGPGNLVHYVAAKSAVMGFTRALARALGPHHITVNAIAPGLITTEPTVALYSPAYFDLHASRRSIKRWAWPADLAGTLLFLCSPDSDFVTGQTIVVDGGQVFS